MDSTKSREVIWGGRNRAAKMNAERAGQHVTEAAREADRAEAHAVLRMEGFGGPASLRQRSAPTARDAASLKCRSCRKVRYAPPVHMIKLTEREITPYKWVHPDEDR
jgi:hypothetical protein